MRNWQFIRISPRRKNRVRVLPAFHVKIWGFRRQQGRRPRPVIRLSAGQTSVTSDAWRMGGRILARHLTHLSSYERSGEKDFQKITDPRSPDARSTLISTAGEQDRCNAPTMLSLHSLFRQPLHHARSRQYSHHVLGGVRRQPRGGGDGIPCVRGRLSDGAIRRAAEQSVCCKEKRATIPFWPSRAPLGHQREQGDQIPRGVAPDSTPRGALALCSGLPSELQQGEVEKPVCVRLIPGQCSFPWILAGQP